MLTIIFLVLKLNGVIDWEWMWVLSPLWIGTLFSAIVFVLSIAYAAIGALFSTMVENIKTRKEK